MWNSNNLNHSQQLGLLIQTLFWEDEKTFIPLLIGFMCIYLREPPRLIRDYHRFSRLSLFPPAYCTTILPTFHTGIDDLLQRVCHNQSCFKIGLLVASSPNGGKNRKDDSRAAAILQRVLHSPCCHSSCLRKKLPLWKNSRPGCQSEQEEGGWKKLLLWRMLRKSCRCGRGLRWGKGQKVSQAR